MTTPSKTNPPKPYIALPNLIYKISQATQDAHIQMDIGLPIHHYLNCNLLRIPQHFCRGFGNPIVWKSTSSCNGLRVRTWCGNFVSIQLLFWLLSAFLKWHLCTRTEDSLLIIFSRNRWTGYQIVTVPPLLYY